MIKIAQFGEGNFLRTFVDDYFNELNKKYNLDFEVHIIKPIQYGLLDKFIKQDNKYNIVLRGYEDNKFKEEIREISVVKDVFSPFENMEKYISLAEDKDLKIIVSNTTEAGISFNKNDDFNIFNTMTFPAKLTVFLYKRFKAKLDGVYILPVELIDNNATKLQEYVNKYIKLWNLSEEFYIYNNEKNIYCNTLVDRIVSGAPRLIEDENYFLNKLGKKDELLSIGELYGLWVIEDKKDISKILKSGKNSVEIIFSKNIDFYKKRKVRILNGSHTLMVAIGLWKGVKTVYELMENDVLRNFLITTLNDEILPMLSTSKETKEYADSVIKRFRNPKLNHRLGDIFLNCISKWQARVLPTIEDYFKKYHKLPEKLMISFAYIVLAYKKISLEDKKFVCNFPEEKLFINDEFKFCNYFISGGDVADFIKFLEIDKTEIIDLQEFIDVTEKNIFKIISGNDLL